MEKQINYYTKKLVSNNFYPHNLWENHTKISRKRETVGTLRAIGYSDLADDYDSYYTSRCGVANTLHTAICLTEEELSKSGYSIITEKLRHFSETRLTKVEREIARVFFEESFARLKKQDAITKELIKKLMRN